MMVELIFFGNASISSEIANISSEIIFVVKFKNYQRSKQTLPISRYGLQKLNYQRSKLPISGGYQYQGIPVFYWSINSVALRMSCFLQLLSVSANLMSSLVFTSIQKKKRDNWTPRFEISRLQGMSWTSYSYAKWMSYQRGTTQSCISSGCKTACRQSWRPKKS